MYSYIYMYALSGLSHTPRPEQRLRPATPQR